MPTTTLKEERLTIVGTKFTNERNFGVWQRLRRKAILEALVAAFPDGKSFSLPFSFDFN